MRKGFLKEVFSSIQGEGGSVRGSCFGKRQIFIRLAGCNVANGDYGSAGCFWCDSPLAKLDNPEFMTFHPLNDDENGPQKIKNPLHPHMGVPYIKKLITPDMHSISFTGGEPTLQHDFLLNLIKTLGEQGINYPFYLETNGSVRLDEQTIRQIAKPFTYCCCDIKDRSAGASGPEQWKELVEIELKFIKLFIEEGVNTFAKIVVTSRTKREDIITIAERLSNISYADGTPAGLAIQLVWLEQPARKKKYAISNTRLNELFYAAAAHLPPESLTLSIQAHKCLNIP